MKVLISAIACAPGGGSEGGLGWAAVLEIAKRHDLNVLTHAGNRRAWEAAEADNQIPGNIRVRFIGTDEPWHSNRLVARLQSWWRLLRFNRELLRAAESWYKEEPFELAHHVTYGTWRVPSPLWRLPVPFVWGPIGGVATIPQPFRSMLGSVTRGMEAARDLQGKLAERSRSLRDCLKNTEVVLAANDETVAFLRRFERDGSTIRLPAAFVTPEKFAKFKRAPARSESAELRLFAGGNIEGRKGVSLALRALAKVREAGVSFRYTVAGGGPEIGKLRSLAESLGIEDRVEFHPGFRGDDYLRALHQADIYLLPSFRETTPVTLLESILAGCYPVVADASAAGEMVRIAGGTAVAAETPEAMIDGLAQSLIQAAGDRIGTLERAAEASRRVAEQYSAARYRDLTEEAYQAALRMA